MANTLFYAMVILFAIHGSKKCAPEAAFNFVSIGMASYFSIWTMPLTLQILEYIPKIYHSYAVAGLLTVSWIIIFAIARTVIEKMLDNYPVFDSSATFAEMPGTAKAAGFVYGACSGYAAAAFIMLVLTFIPGEYPVISDEAFAECADRKILSYSGKVNMLASSKWNEQQKKFLEDTLVKKYRNAEQKEKEAAAKKPLPSPKRQPAAPRQTTPAPAPAPEPAPPAPANEDNAVPATDAQTTPAAEKENIPETKAVNGIVFSCLVPVLRADGSSTGFERSVKVGIRIDSDTPQPGNIEAEIPHPTRSAGKHIIRKIKINLNELDCARVENLNPQIEVKYTVVDNK